MIFLLPFFRTIFYPLASVCVCVFGNIDKSLCACARPGAQRKLTSGVDQAYANAVQSIRDRCDEQRPIYLLLLGVCVKYNVTIRFKK